MGKYIISINQMAEYSRATESAKMNIIKQQQNPNKIKIAYYQMPKSCVKKCIQQRGNLKPIFDGINTLMARKPETKRQEIDKNVSIEAMERFVTMKLPNILKEIDYEVVKPIKKSTNISEVEVIVSPDLIIKGVIDGKIVIGALKIHVSKRKPFELQEAQLVSATIYNYLKNEIAIAGEEILPELCFCLDIFGNRLISAKDSHLKKLPEIVKICDEIKAKWDAA